jgi:dienelactone hydrolase
MNQLLKIACSSLLLGLLAACGSAARDAGAPASPPATFSDDILIASRSVSVPATFAGPAGEPGPAPLVVLVHGHGGTRHEAGGFTAVADALAARGIYSIRMDFAGCGDSTESFANNSLGTMQADIVAARRYAQGRMTLDPARVALLGFSMGGRLALHRSAADGDYRAIALWAPSVAEGGQMMARFFGGQEGLAAKRAQAEAEGFVSFTTEWGQEQALGPQWFADLAASAPLGAAAAFEGDLLVLYGSEDQVVVPAESRSAASAALRARSVRTVVVPGADHGLGLFNGDAESARMTVSQTVEFLAGALTP